MIRRKNSSRTNPVSDAITSEDVLGKDVIDPAGTFLGIVDALYIDPKSLDVMGISVDKGFLREGLIIGKEYVREVTEHAVLLNTRLVFRIRGMDVFDARGRLMGVVKEVVLTEQQNKIAELLVSESRMSSKTVSVPADLIERVDENVFLKD